MHTKDAMESNEMAETWKSPRKIDEEIKEYKRKRFETYMEMADRGEITRSLAIQAFKEEDSYLLWVAEGEEGMAQAGAGEA